MMCRELSVAQFHVAKCSAWLAAPLATLCWCILVRGPLLLAWKLKVRESAAAAKRLAPISAATRIKSATMESVVPEGPDIAVVVSVVHPAKITAMGSAAPERARMVCAVAKTRVIAAVCVAPIELFAVRVNAVVARPVSASMANVAFLASSAMACAASRTKFAVTAKGAWIDTNLRLSAQVGRSLHTQKKLENSRLHK